MIVIDSPPCLCDISAHNKLFIRSFPVKKSITQGTLTAAAILVCSLAQGADDTLSSAQQLLSKGQGAQAYTLLEPLEAERAGELNYDLTLGQAALEAGQNTRAVFALERVLAVEPNNVRARAEIARVYLALGETGNARQEFQNVKQQSIPTEVEATIDRFLAAVERLEDEGRTQVRGYLEFGAGTDSNVNSGAGRSDIAIPLFGGALFTLDANSRRSGDLFSQWGGGVNFRNPLQPRLAITGGLTFTQRLNKDDTDFDNSNWDGNLGLTYTEEKNQYSFVLQGNTFRLNGERFRDAFGFTTQWQHTYDSRNQASLYLQYADLSYPGQSVRDADRWVVGGAYAHAFRTGAVVYAGAYLGTEREKTSGVPHLGHDLVGIRAGGQVELAPRWTGFINANLEQRHYGGNDPFFLSTRQDLQSNFTIGANFAASREWRITPQLSLTRNDSNMELNDYRREVLSITAHRDF